MLPILARHSVFVLALASLVSLVQGQVSDNTGIATLMPAIPNQTGACGVVYNPTDYVASLPTSVFKSELCGKTVTITSPEGKTCDAKVVDQCTNCNPVVINVSGATFKEFAPASNGFVPEVSWVFKNETTT